MDRPSPTPSFEDSGIGSENSKTGSPQVPSHIAPSAPSPAPPFLPNNDRPQAQDNRAGPRPTPFDYTTAARMHALNSNQHYYSDTWPENQVTLPPSRPGSVPSVSPDGHTPSEAHTAAPGSPTSPSRQRVEEDNIDGEVVERALSLPRGRRTPSLRNAPELRWDLSRPLLPRSSLDDLGSVVSEDDVPVGRRERERARLSPVVERPSPVGERSQHHDRMNFSRPTPARYSRTGSPSRIPDAVSEHQPHRLSPLHESPDLRPQRHPREYSRQPALSPQPPYRSNSSRATYSAEDEDPSLSTAQLLDVRRVTNEDVRRSEITIVRSSRDGDEELEPLSSGKTEHPAPEVEYQQFLRHLRERAARHRADRHTFRRRMRRIWGKVRGFFDF